MDIAPDIDINLLKPSLRVALRSDSYQLQKILPSKIDPLVSLMMVEKVKILYFFWVYQLCLQGS